MNRTLPSSRHPSRAATYLLGLTLLAAPWHALAAQAPTLRASVSEPSSSPSPAVTVTDITPATAPLRVVVSIPPLKGLVEPLLPSGSTVDVLIPPGVSEHGHEIPPARLATLAAADVVVTVGLGLEPSVEKFLRDRPNAARLSVAFSTLVGLDAAASANSATDSSKKKTDAHNHDGHAHAHGHDHDHSHDDHAHDEHGNCLHADANDPHLWLDPVLTKQFVSAFADKLAQRTATPASPSNTDATKTTPSTATPNATLTKARDTLTAKLDDLDLRYRKAIESSKNRTIIVGHDAYGRLAARYGLTTVALAGMHASEPTPAAIQRAVETVKSKKAKVVFAEPQVSQAAAKRVAQLTGAEVKILDPLGDGDYFKLMDRNLEALRSALSE